MIFADLCYRAAFLARQAGWSDALPAPDWRALVNRAVADFSWDSEYNEETATITSVANQSVYTIDAGAAPRYFKSVRAVAYAVQTSSPSNLQLSNESDESAVDPLWWQRPAGTPVRFLVASPNSITIVPGCVNSGDTIAIRGTRSAAPLVADSDVPAFPDTWHEALALRAAVLHCEPWVAGDDVAKLQLYREQYAGMVRACVQFLAGTRYARIQRRVQRPIRRRTYIRQSGRY